MSNVALHPTVMNLHAIQKLERETGLSAVVHDFHRVELVPHSQAPTPVKPTFRTTARIAVVTDHDQQPTPPTAA